MLLAGRDDKILRRGMLQHQPLGTDIVARMAPIPPRIQVTQVQCLLKTDMNAGQGPGDLAGNERLTAYGRLMIEEDAVTCEQAVSLTVIDRNPVGIHLSCAIGRTRVKRRGLPLRHLLDLAEHLRSRGL